MIVYEGDREIAVRIALLMYAHEPCRICGEEIKESDLDTAVFAGYNQENTSRSAHATCWNRLSNEARAEIIRQHEARRAAHQNK